MVVKNKETLEYIYLRHKKNNMNYDSDKRLDAEEDVMVRLEKCKALCKQKSEGILELALEALYERDIDKKQWYIEKMAEIAITKKSYEKMIEDFKTDEGFTAWDKSTDPRS